MYLPVWVLPGVETPSLKVSRSEIFEGEELNVECRAPKEEGPFSFNFYQNSTLLNTNSSKENSLSTKLKLEQSGEYEVHCSYKLLLFQATSEKSNREAVAVRGEWKHVPTLPRLTFFLFPTITLIRLLLKLTIMLEISFLPLSKIMMGNRLEVHFRVCGILPLNLEVLIMKGYEGLNNTCGT